jgi:hypothetical protein
MRGWGSWGGRFWGSRGRGLRLIGGRVTSIGSAPGGMRFEYWSMNANSGIVRWFGNAHT